MRTDRLHPQYVHDVVNHAETYVKGRVHTNGLENFWSLLKRHLSGTCFVAVEPFHLSRYLDEQVFRFNNGAPKDNPVEPMQTASIWLYGTSLGSVSHTEELTGKEGETATA